MSRYVLIRDLAVAALISMACSLPASATITLSPAGLDDGDALAKGMWFWTRDSQKIETYATDAGTNWRIKLESPAGTPKSLAIEAQHMKSTVKVQG